MSPGDNFFCGVRSDYDDVDEERTFLCVTEIHIVSLATRANVPVKRNQLYLAISLLVFAALSAGLMPDMSTKPQKAIRKDHKVRR